MKNLAILLFLIIPGFTFCQLDFENYGCKHKKHIFSKQSKYKQSAKLLSLLNKYDVGFYFLDIEVSDTTTYIKGNTFIEATTLTSMDTFSVELKHNMEIDSVVFNDELENYTRTNDEVYIPLSSALPANTKFNCKIYYQGKPETTGFFSGVSTGYSEQFDTHVTWTLSEPFSALDWWPTKQILSDKADSCWVFLTTSASNMAGSQGLLTNIADLPDNKKRYEWKSSYPIDYYLISFAVANYQEYNIYSRPDALQGDSILIQNFIYNHPSCLGTYKQGIDNTIDFLELFSDLYALYPFYEEKYGHCLTEMGGGMEHQTMTSIGNFNYGIVAHELGHMWWGDYVTCATWSDIWINEGFATYSDYLAHEFLAGGDYPQIWLTQVHEEVLEETSGSIYIPPEEIANEDDAAVERIFDVRLSYLKGASIIHMLRFKLDDDLLFFEILRSFLNKYSDSVATGADFMHHFSEESGTDYSYFFDQWYYGQGYPIYDINWNWQDGELTMNTYQSTSAPETSFFDMHMQYKLIFSDSSHTLLRLHQQQHNESYQLNTEKEVIGIIVDPNNWNLEKVNSITHGIIPLPSEVYRLWPNPSSGIFYVQLPGTASSWFEYEIFNNNGKKIISGKTHQPLFEIDMRQFSSGIYIAKFKAEGNTFYEKLVRSVE